MKISKVYLSRTSMKSATITLTCAETPRQTEEWKSFLVEKKEDFKCTLIGGCWHKKAGGGLTSSAVYYMID